MRRSITVVSLVVVALAAVACGGGGKDGSSSVSSTTPAPPVTTVPAATTTTEEPPSSAAPSTTTTTLITDATTADPKALAAQLQTVFDRYQVLYQESRTDPERPFTDQKLIDEFRQVSEQDDLASLLQIWEAFRKEGSAVRPGPTLEVGGLLTAATSIEARRVGMAYCFYDDAVTYSFATGELINDTTVVSHGVIEFANQGEGWTVARYEVAESTEVPSGSPNPCPGESAS